MKLGSIHVVTEATMAIMQSMIQRLVAEVETQRLALLRRSNRQLLHASVSARFASSAVEEIYQPEPATERALP
jgi:hypothetical protein